MKTLTQDPGTLSNIDIHFPRTKTPRISTKPRVIMMSSSYCLNISSDVVNDTCVYVYKLHTGLANQ